MMFYICLQKALVLKFISLSSNIILEDRIPSRKLQQSVSMPKLLEYYKRMGFKQMFPEHYEKAMENIDEDLDNYIPMIGKVEDIIDSRAEFEIPSDIAVEEVQEPDYIVDGVQSQSHASSRSMSDDAEIQSDCSLFINRVISSKKLFDILSDNSFLHA